MTPEWLMPERLTYTRTCVGGRQDETRSCACFSLAEIFSTTKYEMLIL
jgi:hypothetical protein